MGWAKRVRRLFGKAELERQIDVELAFHMAERADELEAAGMCKEEARRQAAIQFGSLNRQKEEVREINLFPRLETAWRDLRFGVRTLAGTPLFTATAILSLALGVGANTAIFSIIDALMLRSLPVAEPGRLVAISSKELGPWLTYPIWEQMRDHQQSFGGIFAASPDRFDLSRSGESHFARGYWVSGEFFHVLGIPALQGRVFTKEEDRRGTPPTAVISYAFWKRSFADQPNVIGKTIYLNRQPFDVVGVTPPWFRGLDADSSYDVIVPLTCEPLLHTDRSMLDERAAWWLHVVGRLMPSGNPEQAAAGLNTLAPAVLRATFPSGWPAEAANNYLHATFQVAPAATGFSEVRSHYRTALFTLLATAVLVLLITCANIANLLLARASVRRRELAVRLALGATRRRLLRQLLTESLLLSIAGTALGFLLAAGGSRLLVRMISTERDPLSLSFAPDASILAFTACAAILTALLFGLAPAFSATRGDLNMSLKDNARGAVAGATRLHLGKLLVAGQIALSLTLLVAAGLFLGTLRNLLTTDIGFDRHGVLSVEAEFQPTAIAKERRLAMAAEIVRRVRSIPGVLSAASSLRTPITNFGWNEEVQPEGYHGQSRRDTLLWLNRVSPDYFATLHTPLLQGRDFADSDSLRAPKVMILSEGAARRFFADSNALGKTVVIGRRGGTGAPEVYQVIGVVGNSKYASINEPERLGGFVAAGQDDDPSAHMDFVMRSSGNLGLLAKSVRQIITSSNPNVSLIFRELDGQVNESIVQPRMVALLSATFGLLALALAVIGLYGITAYGVSRRRNEIGIRIALGAHRSTVIGLVMRDVGLLVAGGIAAGLVASLALGRLIQSLLFGLRPNDPAQLALAAATLAVCTLLAAYVPARRAARLDPLEALREE